MLNKLPYLEHSNMMAASIITASPVGESNKYPLYHQPIRMIPTMSPDSLFLTQSGQYFVPEIKVQLTSVNLLCRKSSNLKFSRFASESGNVVREFSFKANFSKFTKHPISGGNCTILFP